MYRHSGEPVVRRDAEAPTEKQHKRSESRPNVPIAGGDQKLMPEAVSPAARNGKDVRLHRESDDDQGPCSENQGPAQETPHLDSKGKRHRSALAKSYARGLLDDEPTDGLKPEGAAEPT